VKKGLVIGIGIAIAIAIGVGVFATSQSPQTPSAELGVDESVKSEITQPQEEEFVDSIKADVVEQVGVKSKQGNEP